MNTYFIRIFLCLIFVSFSSLLFSQNDLLKEKSIFWEITPKNGGKSSYLYGTMHVSKKVAFQLPEKFYEAIEASDVVALESNPSNWSRELENSEDLRDLFNMYSLSMHTASNTGKNYYRTTYGLQPFKNDILKEELSYEPISINNLLFRSFRMNRDFEKDTYLDLYIYKTAKRFNKEVADLESIVWSTTTVLKGSMVKPKKKNKKYVSGASISKDLEDAYRKRDLLKIDSLVKVSSPSDEYINALLYIRNDTMFSTIDRYIKNGKTIFAAAGAAHLVGDKGLLVKLKEAGYNVRPVKEAFNLLPSAKVNKLDSTFLPVKFTKKYSADSSLSFYTPAYNSRSVMNGKVEYLSTDMANGVYYYIGRLNTFQNLNDLNATILEKKIDSLLFENVAGKIISNTKSKHQSYPTIDVKSLTREGKLHKLKIIITPLEILFCKVVGQENYFDSYNVDTFFNKIDIQYLKNNNLSFMKDVDVHMPVSIRDQPYLSSYYGSPNEMVQGLDANGDYFQLLRNYTPRGIDHEVDTFHLNMYQFFIARTFNYKVLNARHGFINGLPYLDVEFKTKKNKRIFTKIISRASNIYFLTTTATNRKKRSEFFNSFLLKENPGNITTTYVDTTESFEFNTNLRPMGGTLTKELFAQGLEEYSVGEKYKKTFLTLLRDNDRGYQFTITKYKLNKYLYYPTVDSFWNEFVKDNFETNDEKYIVSKKIWTENNQHKMSLHISDTGSVNLGRYLYATAGDDIFEVVAFRDTSSNSYAPVETGLSTFNILDPKPTILTTSKLDTLVNHLYSSDSTTKEFFSNNYAYFSVAPSDEDQFLSLLDTSQLLKEKDRVFESLLFELIDYKTPKTRAFIKKMYEQNEDNSSRQVTLLNVLASMRDTPSTMLYKDLIITSAPLGFDEGDNPLNYYYDSLSLAKILFPDVLQLIDYDDYKMGVIYLLENLYVDKKIEPAIYESKVNYFTSKGIEEIKRRTSQKSSLQEAKEKDDDEDNSEYSTKPSSISFDVTDEKDKWDSKINFYDFGTIETYAILLKPYQSRPSVQRFFTKMDSTKNKDLKCFFAIKKMKDTLPFDKDIINDYAALPEYRYKVLHDFYFKGQMAKLPFEVKNQEETARLRIQDLAEIADSKELTLVSKIKANAKHDKGYVYVFKYPVKDETRYGFMGLFAENKNDLVPKRSLRAYNIDIEEQSEKEFIENLKNQLRVMERTFISPKEMIQKDENEFDFARMIRESMRD